MERITQARLRAVKPTCHIDCAKTSESHLTHKGAMSIAHRPEILRAPHNMSRAETELRRWRARVLAPPDTRKLPVLCNEMLIAKLRSGNAKIDTSHHLPFASVAPVATPLTTTRIASAPHASHEVLDPTMIPSIKSTNPVAFHRS